MVTMKFNGRDTLDEFGLYVNQHTTFLPLIEERTAEVDGMDGFHDFGNSRLMYRMLVAECAFKDPRNAIAMQRQLALLFSKRGNISFSDEPDKYYIGRIYNGVDLQRMDYKGRKFDLEFKCQPYLMGATRTIRGGTEIPVPYAGTVRTPMRIIIRNMGNTDIENITLQHIIIER